MVRVEGAGQCVATLGIHREEMRCAPQQTITQAVTISFSASQARNVKRLNDAMRGPTGVRDITIGIEPTTCSLGSCCATIERRPRCGWD